MCEPLTMGMIGASAVMGGVTAGMEAKSQKDALKYQQGVDNNNAIIAQQQSNDAKERGVMEAQQAMRQQAQTRGAQIAAMSANGIDISQGSALDILATTDYLGQADVNTIQSNAAREAWGYDVQEMNLKADSQMKKWQAGNINPAMIGSMAAASSLLGSATNYAAAGRFKGGKSGTVSPMKVRAVGGIGWPK